MTIVDVEEYLLACGNEMSLTVAKKLELSEKSLSELTDEKNIARGKYLMVWISRVDNIVMTRTLEYHRAQETQEPRMNIIINNR